MITMPQAKFVNGDSIGSVRQWIMAHNSDYARTRDRLEYVRNVVLNGRIDAAVGILKKSYLFAVMSIKTERERHERAFTAYHASDMGLKDACLETVYGGQKYGWIERTFDSVDWDLLVRSIRANVPNGHYAELLNAVVDNCVGVSYRKGSFMLAMAGMYEFMCVDSNVARYAGIDKKHEFDDAREYMQACREIVDGIDMPMPPFMVQWAIYDFERGEHARHMPYFREAVGL